MADFGEEAKENAQEDLILWRRREARVRVPMGRGKNLGEQCSSHNNAFEDLEQSRRFRPPKPMEKASHGRATTASESARVGFRKNDLNSASLFCPSGSSSNKEANSTHEKYGALDLSPRPSVMAEVSQSNFAGGKENVSVLLGMMDNLCITDSISKPQIYLPPHRRNLQPSGQQLVAQSAGAPKTSHALDSMDLKSSSTESNASTTALPLAGKGKSCISSGGMTLDGANHNAPPSAQPTSKRIVLRGYVHGLVWSDDELSDSNPSDEEQEPIPEDEIDTWILNHQIPPVQHPYRYPRPEPDPYEDDPTHPDARRGWVH